MMLTSQYDDGAKAYCNASSLQQEAAASVASQRNRGGSSTKHTRTGSGLGGRRYPSECVPAAIRSHHALHCRCHTIS